MYWYLTRHIDNMKKLTDEDIANMIGAEYTPTDKDVRRGVRTQLGLSKKMPLPNHPVPKHSVLDLHQLTEEQAWEQIMKLATSGARSATIITGASGILKIKFQQWAQDSLLSPYIISWEPVNNGSFAVKFKKV